MTRPDRQNPYRALLTVEKSHRTLLRNANTSLPRRYVLTGSPGHAAAGAVRATGAAELRRSAVGREEAGPKDSMAARSMRSSPRPVSRNPRVWRHGWPGAMISTTHGDRTSACLVASGVRGDVGRMCELAVAAHRSIRRERVHLAERGTARGAVWYTGGRAAGGARPPPPAMGNIEAPPVYADAAPRRSCPVAIRSPIRSCRPSVGPPVAVVQAGPPQPAAPTVMPAAPAVVAPSVMGPGTQDHLVCRPSACWPRSAAKSY